MRVRTTVDWTRTSTAAQHRNRRDCVTLDELEVEIQQRREKCKTDDSGCFR